MATTDEQPADNVPRIPAKSMAELQRAVENAIRGIRDPELMDRAAKEMGEGREEIRRQFGELDPASELTGADDRCRRLNDSVAIESPVRYRG
jgi:hypothetical protein